MVDPMALRNQAHGPAWILAIVLVMGTSAQDTFADTFYQFVDKNGVIHFSNVPTDPRYKKVWVERSRTRLIPTAPSMQLHHAIARTIAQTSDQHRLDPALIRAIIRAESSFDPEAVSPRGAMGLMQLMPETASSLKVSNPYDPEQNITGGARHLRYLLDRFGGDVRLALAAYNAGESRVLRESRIPPISETREYVRRVLRYYKEYSRKDDASLLVSRRFINYLSPN